ncbi:MAG TPA: hypothetical protein VN785_12275 [Candidatus Angelobacter sp.]|nr:hypothetical protein [Candidatus Angelobacter sp.]
MAGAHQMGALLGGIEEISIDEGEAENLARAVLAISKKRKVKLSPEMLAWGNFAAVVATIYGPRLIAFLARRREMNEKKILLSNAGLRAVTEQPSAQIPN